MDKTATENRQFPRVSLAFPIQITPNFLGETVNLSETGLKFILQKPLLLSKAQARIELSPQESIDTEFKVIWNKQLVTDGKFTYGACFIRLKEKDIRILRDIALRAQIQSILGKIDSIEDKNRIVKFWFEDFKIYLNRLIALSNQLVYNQTILIDGVKILKEINDNIMQKCDILETEINNKIIIKKIKKIFREFCWPCVSKSFIVKRAFEKPLGYPGDYRLLETIYDNLPVSEKIGYCIDHYFLNNEYAIAVRNRKEKMRDLLISYINKSKLSSVKILNLGCGLCREIREALFKKQISQKNILFTLVDQDRETLGYAENILRDISGEGRFQFLEHNILDYIKKGGKYFEILKGQDIIYTIGLADYLTDRILRDLISFCFSLLKPNGRLIIAHKDITKYKPLAPDWWCDWTFYSRDEKKLINIVNESRLSNFHVEIERESSEIIFFLIISKK